MDFKSELIENIKNKIYLISILGVDIDSNLTTDVTLYYSVPETINITAKYLESEVNSEYTKMNLYNFQNQDNVIKMCKRLLKELISEIYTLFIICTSGEIDIDTKEDFNLLKESADEFVEQDVKYFVKVQTGKIWNDDNAKCKIKRVKQNLINILSALNRHTEYKEV